MLISPLCKHPFFLRCHPTGQLPIHTHTHTHMSRLVKDLIPKLTSSLSKGQMGRLAVVGGCEDYTGAPYFAGHAALVAGVDLVHIITDQAAAAVIKTYSPDLMVHPYLHTERIVDVCKLVDRCDVVIVGPGYGRDAGRLNLLREIVEHVLQNTTTHSLLMDADALYALSTDEKLADIVRSKKESNSNATAVVVTPNGTELHYLLKANGVNTIEELAKALHVVVVAKGGVDRIAGEDDGSVLECNEAGSLKRAGGQGDTLTGVMGAFLCWRDIKKDAAISASAACYAGCYVTRRAGHAAYLQHGRSMLASDVHRHIGSAFKALEQD